MTELSVEFCGEWFTPDPLDGFAIGREGDLAMEDNPYLHRRFLQLFFTHGFWWLANQGSRISATVADVQGGVQAWLAPGASIPLVFGRTTVVFTAGPTTYELSVHQAQPAFQVTAAATAPGCLESTMGAVSFTPAQKALIVALAEPLLSRDGTGLTALPTSVQAARRLGWGQSRFNRKLDNVCAKLDQAGVAGLRGTGSEAAANRRARLVEHVVTSHLVTVEDLALLASPLAPGEE